MPPRRFILHTKGRKENPLAAIEIERDRKLNFSDQLVARCRAMRLRQSYIPVTLLPGSVPAMSNEISPMQSPNRQRLPGMVSIARFNPSPQSSPLGKGERRNYARRGRWQIRGSFRPGFAAGGGFARLRA